MTTKIEDDPDIYDERGILRDGRALRVPLQFIDGVPKTTPRLYALDGGPAGCRPGVVLDREPPRVEVDHAATDAAYADYDRWLRDAHRGGRAPEPPPTDRDAAEALRVTRMHLALQGGRR